MGQALSALHINHSWSKIIKDSPRKILGEKVWSVFFKQMSKPRFQHLLRGMNFLHSLFMFSHLFLEASGPHFGWHVILWMDEILHHLGNLE